jgi:hypothetical protein
MIEFVCYVKLDELSVFLEGVIGMLNESGTLVIRLHDFNKHQKYVEAVRDLYSESESAFPNLLCASSGLRKLITDPQLHIALT